MCALVLCIHQSLTSSLTVSFAVVGDLLRFLPESADSWIRPGQSAHWVVTTKEVQITGLAIVSLSLSHPSPPSLIGAMVQLRSIALALSSLYPLFQSLVVENPNNWNSLSQPRTSGGGGHGRTCLCLVLGEPMDITKGMKYEPLKCFC